MTKIKNYIKGRVNFVKEQLSRFVRLDHNKQQSKRLYDDLTPSEEIVGGETYFEALLDALQSRLVKNIALTGPYGSGKSSILRSFEKKYKQYTYLNISLATFSEKVEGDNRTWVENSILQQLFYHVHDSDIPYSRFKRIKRIPGPLRLLYTLAIFIWSLATVLIFAPDFYLKIAWWKAVEAATKEIWLYIAFGIFFSGAAFLIYYLQRILSNAKFNKLNMGGHAVIELASDRNPLNQHLDEILYFFESNPFDVVVIEDLDRFENPEIFTTLREINTLINNSKQIGRRVVFIYAIKDDIFREEKSRTKFFDFIIPVIPIINSSNSGDILLNKLKDLGFDNTISEEFISDITLYVDDMRLLKNIINEFRMYKERVGKGLQDEKLLAMMVYKNLYPDDFALLNTDKGIVYQVFQNKSQYINSLKEEEEKEINELQRKILAAERAALRNIQELKAVYIQAILEKLPSRSAILIDGTEQHVKNLKEEEIFKKLTELHNIQYRDNYTYNLNCSFHEIENEIDASKSYEARRVELENKDAAELQKLKNSLTTHLEKEQLLAIIHLRKYLVNCLIPFSIKN